MQLASPEDSLKLALLDGLCLRTCAHVTEMERLQEAGGGACRERQTALVGLNLEKNQYTTK